MHNDYVCSLQYSIFSFDRPKYYGHATQFNPIHKSFIIFKEAKFHIFFCASPFLVPTVSVFDIDYSPSIIHKSRSP